MGEVGAKRREGDLLHETQCSSLRDSLSDQLLTPGAIAHHVVIPEPQHLKALRTQPRGPRRILDLATRLIVLAAVNLDDNTSAAKRPQQAERSERVFREYATLHREVRAWAKPSLRAAHSPRA